MTFIPYGRQSLDDDDIALADRLYELMAAHPTLCGELSYRSGLLDAGGRLAPEWRALFIEMPQRFMIGSDTWVNERWSSYEALMQEARQWLGELPAPFAQHIGWDNAAMLYGLPRPA